MQKASLSFVAPCMLSAHMPCLLLISRTSPDHGYTKSCGDQVVWVLAYRSVLSIGPVERRQVSFSKEKFCWASHITLAGAAPR